MLFTARRDGNMSSVGGEGCENGARSRGRLRERIGLRALVRGHQVHGTVVHRIEDPPRPDAAEDPALRADGQLTALKEVGAMVLAADCLPVALGSAGAVAMLHAGWRGLAAGVLEEGVGALRGLSPGAEILAVIGPCAGPCCYEVGPEVHRALGAEHGRGPIDLPAIARERLLAAGAREVIWVEACTICDERYFSFRREGSLAGRQAGVAWLS